MPLQKLSFDDFSDKTEMIICLRDHHNQLVDYCNELERRLAGVEKPKRNYLSDDYTLCVRCNNIHHKDIECNNK